MNGKGFSLVMQEHFISTQPSALPPYEYGPGDLLEGGPRLVHGRSALATSQ